MKTPNPLLWMILVSVASTAPICEVKSPDDCNPKCMYYGFDTVTNCMTCECVDGDGMFEGDIKVDEEAKEKITAMLNSNGKERGISTQFTRWTDYPNGDNYEIPYVLDSSLPSAAIIAINSAISQFDSNTCLRLVPRTYQLHYIRFFQETGCWSYVGRLDGRSDISIGLGCETPGIVIHEVMHSLTFFHEQSRPDRDIYVNIITEKIQPSTIGNFQKYSSSEIDSMGSPYDYTSVMHYGPTAFSIDGSPTITKADGSPLTETQITTFAQSDIDQINGLYCTDPTTTTTEPSGASKMKISNYILALFLSALFHRIMM